MLIEYIEAALKKAHYEIIDDKEPFYGEIPKLKRGFRGLDIIEYPEKTSLTKNW
jgi:hypothetical protein